MPIKPNYSWWIIVVLVVVATTLGGCFVNTHDPGYVRTAGAAYTWTDVPRYNGRAVYFDRYGRPMVNRAGVWYYVPRTAAGYRHYGAYNRRVRLCRSGARNAYYTKYCGRSALTRRVYVRNRSPYRSRTYRRSYRTRRTYTSPRRYRTSRSYPRATTTRRTTTTRRYGSQGPGRRYDSRGRYTGRTDKNGRMYDSRGRYLGRVRR